MSHPFGQEYEENNGKEPDLKDVELVGHCDCCLQDIYTPARMWDAKTCRACSFGYHKPTCKEQLN